MDSIDPKKIAEGLTEAQREAVLSSGSPTHIRPFTTARCRAALQDKGVVTRAMYSEELTPLGLAVRSHLLGEAG